MSVEVKICGITRLEDALDAAALGAEAVGLNFWPGSRRRCAVEEARRIVEALPRHTVSVGVFVDPTEEDVASVVAQTGIQWVQLHGEEPPDLCARMPRPVIKAIPGASAAAASARAHRAALLLFDSGVGGSAGRGVRLDWEALRAAAPGEPFILAGGLDPDNVAAAIRAVRPAVVDVASGVERAAGIKDRALMERFIHAVKEV